MTHVGLNLDSVDASRGLDRVFGEIKRLGFSFAEASAKIETGAAALSTVADTAARHSVAVQSVVLAEFAALPKLPAPERREMVAGLAGLIETCGAAGYGPILIPARVVEDELDRFRVYSQALDELAPVAHAAGTSLAVEFVGGADPYDVARLVEQSAHENIGLYFDIGNCLYAGVDPVAALSDLLGLVRQIHLKGGPVTPFAAMPLRRVRELLEERDYSGLCAVEIEPACAFEVLRDAAATLWMNGFQKVGPR